MRALAGHRLAGGERGQGEAIGQGGALVVGQRREDVDRRQRRDPGQVVDIRWRYTAIETRAWETIIVPNSMLMKGQVVVLGRRQGEATKARRQVDFLVDFRTPPTEVIAAVRAALHADPPPRVEAEPPPQVLFLAIRDSVAAYAVRYLAELGALEVLPALRRLARDEDAERRTAASFASRALKAERSRDAGERFLIALSEGDRAVRAALARRLRTAPAATRARPTSSA